MAEYRRQFAATPHDGGLLITAGNRMIRLSADEVDELAEQIAAPVVAREVCRITGVER